MIDMDRYNALGLSESDFPKDWSELNEQISDLARDGNPGIYLPFWCTDNVGLPLSFAVEVLNRGGSVVHPSTHGVSMKSNEGPAYDTLVDWRFLMESGAVDSRVLDMNFPEFIEAFENGDHVFNSITTEAFLRVKEKGGQPPRKIRLLPRVHASWGVQGSLSMGIAYNPHESAARRAAKRKLLQIYAHGSAGDKFSVARNWLLKLGYFSSYRDFMESDEARDILRSKMVYPEDVDVLLDVFDHLSYPRGEWGVQWHDEFFRFMAAELRLYLANPSISPSEVIHSLNGKIRELRLLYGY